MELNGVRTVRIVVEYNNLDKFITDYFQFEKNPNHISSWEKPNKDGKFIQPYEFVALEEANNYASYDYPDIDGILDEFEQKDMQKMLDEKKFHMYRTRVILQYLASQGAIEKGDYMVEVFW